MSLSDTDPLTLHSDLGCDASNCVCGPCSSSSFPSARDEPQSHAVPGAALNQPQIE